MIDACIDTGNEGDKPALFAQSTRTARKQHRCCECDSDIKPGDEYEYTKGLWDGNWQAFKTCRICAAVRRDFCHSYIFGELWESMRETHGLGFDSVDEDWGGPEPSDEDWARLIKRRADRRAGLRMFSTIQDLRPGDALGVTS